MTHHPAAEDRFARNTVVLGKVIHDCIVKLGDKTTINPKLVERAVSFMGIFNHTHLIKGFIRNSHEECWDMIKERDEKFFEENVGKVFSSLPTENVNVFKDLFLEVDSDGKSVIPTDTKERIWSKFEDLVKGSIKYCHANSNPVFDGETTTYTLCSDIGPVDIKHHISNWEIPGLLGKHETIKHTHIS